MTTPWVADQVNALAPDPASLAAGRKQSVASAWSDHGVALGDGVVWGACSGSGKLPYQVAVDLSGPAYKCSCPSRKIPCKHVLGLLLLWTAGGVPAADVPTFAHEWLESRAARAEKAATRSAASAESQPADGAPRPASAASVKRQEVRATRIAQGLDELDQWLQDAVRHGVAGWKDRGPREAAAMAARLVDAQAPTIAATVKDLPHVLNSGERWITGLLEEMALLHLLIAAHRRGEDLEPAMAATVRSRIGYPVTKDDVLREPAIHDTWVVLALEDAPYGRLTARTVTLWGTSTGQIAQIWTYHGPGQPPDGTFLPGQAVTGDLHFYPAGAPLRAVPGTQHTAPAGLQDTLSGAATRAGGVRDALDRYTAAIAGDPWLRRWPALVHDGVLTRRDDQWFLTDSASDALQLTVHGDQGWRLLALSAGAPTTVLVDVSSRGSRLVSAMNGTEVFSL